MTLLTSCNMKDAVSRMGLELKLVKIKDMTNTGFKATVYMQVDNPNRFSITVADMDYEVYINDRLVGKGRIEHEIEIPSGGQVVAELPAEISTDGLDRLVEKILKKEIKYRVKGQVVFKTFLGSYTLPFDKEKEIKKKNALLPAPAEAPGP